jgi:hypothetical protein
MERQKRIAYIGVAIMSLSVLAVNLSGVIPGFADILMPT